MIPVIIFFAHTIFAVWAFGKSYQSDGLVQAILNVCFIIILFTVGWTVSDLIVGIFLSDSGYSIVLPHNPVALTFLKLTGFLRIQGGSGFIQPKDSVSLIVLTVIEYYFYKFYFRQTVIR